jgi:HD-GYP domain-containing protein (c-di-GMP phosphodiesterase class II)
MTTTGPTFYYWQDLPLDRSIFSGLGSGEPAVVSSLDELCAKPLTRPIVLPVSPALAYLQSCPEHAAVVVWLHAGESLPVALTERVGVVGVLDAHSRAPAARSVLRLALALSAPSVDARTVHKLKTVLEIGRALATEKDLDRLLAMILDRARDLTGAEGASVYTKERDGKLYFRLWQNLTVPNTAGVERRPVGEDSVADFVARTNRALLIDDAYAIPADAPYRFNPAFDKETGYRTCSLLTVPLANKAAEVVGVLQLVNRSTRADARGEASSVIPFDENDRDVALAMAGQAGVALENSMLHADIERLFEGFIKASVQAIEARDPTTAGHSFRVAEFTERLAVAVDRADAGTLRHVNFSKDELRELRYAALLHDFGKVGVRENVLVKAKKLYPHELDRLQQRFRLARAHLERNSYRELLALHENRNLSAGEREQRQALLRASLGEELSRLDRFLAVLLKANEPNVTHEEVSSELGEIAAHSLVGDDDQPFSLVEPFEFESLRIAKGSLNEAERSEIESHVTHTYTFLSLIPWTKNLANLPRIAYAHHEKLDGTGYPQRLTPADIPVQSRMLTISDIYDALTAPDRPYKRALPAERALSILETEARAGKVDATLFGVFVEAKAWYLPV